MAINERPLTIPSTNSAKVQTRRYGGEWRLVALITLLMVVLSLIPTIYANVTAPDDRFFTGVIFNIPDHNQYFAWMRDLRHEHLAPNRLTAEPNDPALFHLLWWSAGRIGNFFGVEYYVIFTLLRVVATVLLVSVAYAFLRIAVPDVKQRWLAFLFFCFSGGVGFVWIIVKYAQNLPDAPFPFDIYTSEANSFFQIMAFPHFAIALALLIGMIGLTLYAQQRQQLRYAVAAGLVGTLIGLQHAYDLLTIYSVLGLWGILIWWRDRRFPVFLGKSAAIIAVFTIPPAGYLAYLVLNDATWGGKLAQFDNAGAWTPNLLHLPILMGVPLLLALIAFRPRMLQSRNDTELLIAIWFLVHFVLIYLPLKFQIHLLLGWQMPIAILAATAIYTHVWPWLQQRTPRTAPFLLAVILGLSVATNVYIWTWRLYDLTRYSEPYYLAQSEVAALRWLEAATTRDDVVLGTLMINQHVPVWTDARAFLAHWAGTLDYFEKLRMAEVVLDPAAQPAEREAILNQFAVSYVIAREQDVPREALLDAAPELELVFAENEVSVYRVVLERQP